MTAELERRYGRDYAIVGCAGPEDAADRLAGRAAGGRAASAARAAPIPTGLAVLRGLHRDHPGAMAVAVVRWGALRDRPADLRGAHPGPARPVALRPGGRRRRGVPPGGHRDPRGVVGPAGRRLRGGPDDRRPVVRAGPAPARHASPATASRSASTTPTPPRGGRCSTGCKLESPRLPVVQLRFRPERPVLEDPSDLEIADAFGLLTPLDTGAVYDLVVARLRAGGARRQRLRRLRGAEHARARAGGDRRAGRDQFDDPQLSRLQDGISGNRLAFSAYLQAWAFGSTFHFMRCGAGRSPPRTGCCA